MIQFDSLQKGGRIGTKAKPEHTVGRRNILMSLRQTDCLIVDSTGINVKDAWSQENRMVFLLNRTVLWGSSYYDDVILS